MRHVPETVDDFAFHVEVWTHDDMHVDQTMAVAKNVRLAKAAYEQCFEGARGANRVVAQRLPYRVGVHSWVVSLTLHPLPACRSTRFSSYRTCRILASG
jgi:hypothetical protein